MIDSSRNGVMQIEELKRFISLIKKMGYNSLLLYMEDVYEIKSQPYFGHQRGKYTCDELKDLDNFAFEQGVELIPCIQTLSHLGTIFQWPCYYGFRDYGDTLLAEEECVYNLIDEMLGTVSDCFRTRCVNIGMDEAAFLGFGKYLDKHGIKDRTEILLTHLNKISSMAQKYDLELSMWSDMFFKLLGNNEYYDTDTNVENLRGKIPKNVSLIYWDYYSKEKAHFDERIIKHKQITEDICFAGGIWTWTGFAPHISYSLDSTRESIKSCIENGVKDIFFTMWGDNGNECSRFSVLPAIYAASQFAEGNFDMESIKNGFKTLIGIDFDDFCLAELPNTPNIKKTAENDESQANWINAEKFLLYNDCFMGKFDCVVTEGLGKQYKDISEKLNKLSRNNDYSTVFGTLSALCNVLELKAEIGVRTRKAYTEKDAIALKNIINDYDEILVRLDSFYEAFKKQWDRENKPQGFEVQDARIGGLYKRIFHCKERLEQYINGEIDVIEELNEKMLDYRPGDKKNVRNDILFNSYCSTVSSGNM